MDGRQVITGEWAAHKASGRAARINICCISLLVGTHEQRSNALLSQGGRWEGASHGKITAGIPSPLILGMLALDGELMFTGCKTKREGQSPCPVQRSQEGASDAIIRLWVLSQQDLRW